MKLQDYSRYEIPYLDVSNYFFDNTTAFLLSKEMCIKHEAIGLDRISNTMTVAMVKPNMESIKALEEETNCRVQVFLGHSNHIHNAILKYC